MCTEVLKRRIVVSAEGSRTVFYLDRESGRSKSEVCWRSRDKTKGNPGDRLQCQSADC